MLYHGTPPQLSYGAVIAVTGATDNVETELDAGEADAG